jgi:hypothetical protein
VFGFHCRARTSILIVFSGEYHIRNRWFIYIVVGLCFGFGDWYFLDMLASLGQNQALNESLNQTPEYIRVLIVMGLVISNYGVWLIPVIPTAIYEMKRSHSLLRSAISSVVVWISAIVSYYIYYAFLLMFVGLPNMDFMLFSNRQSATYWIDWWEPFRRVILDQFVEWIIIAVIAGAIVGIMSAYIFNLLSRKNTRREAT